MGARKRSAPRRGSLGYSPRKRAGELVPRVRTWPDLEVGRPLPLAFLGYKVGMTHAYMIDDRRGSPTFGQEVFTPVTVVEVPPVYVLAVRGYVYDANRGLYAVGEAWVNPPSELELWRRIPALGGFKGDGLKRLESALDELRELRVIIATQPKLVGGLSKKAPDLLEVRLGGTSDTRALYEYAASRLGKTVSFNEVFEVGQLVDVIAVTRGKGFQGPVKRWGVKILPRWHKHRKASRKVGARSHARGTWWEIPAAGQTGYHRRTDYNKRIVAYGVNGFEVTPAGGFLHYGVVEGPYAVIAGSIPGTPKRPIVLRHPVRPPSWYLKRGVKAPQLTYLSLSSKQGN